jgi:protein-S-isoprenylcysteine O-methyltransferase Ste14
VWIASPVLWGVVAGGVLCVLGEFVRTWAAGYIHKSRELATRGPYAFVRHPQYLGNCLLAMGFVLASGRLWAIAIWALIFWVFYVPAIRREDEKLHGRFGEAWTEFHQSTPAILPVRWPCPERIALLREWSFLRCVRNGEPIWLALLAGAFVCIVLHLP